MTKIELFTPSTEVAAADVPVPSLFLYDYSSTQSVITTIDKQRDNVTSAAPAEE